MTVTSELEHQLLDQLNLELPRKVLDKFQTLVRESSSDDEKEAFNYLTKLLDEVSVPHTVHYPKIYLSVPKSAKVHISSPENIEFRAKTPAFSFSTNGQKSVPTELVYIAAGDEADEMDVFDVNIMDQQGSFDGKIVLSEGFAMNARVKYFEDRGALGAVFINPGHNIHDGICTSIWGSPDLDNYEIEPNIPVTAINKTDGDYIKKLCQEGEVLVSLETDLKRGWFNCPLLDIHIEGTEEPEKFVLLHGHLDSWTYGLGDNATGDAALVEMARVLHNNRDKLKRSVRIAIWPGHSTGRYAGSTWFADYFGIELDENCVAQVNCDSPGCRWATSYDYMDWTPEVDAFCQKAIYDAIESPSKGNRPVRAGDYSFNNIGITSYYMLSSTLPEDVAKEKGYYPVGGCGGNIEWHTEDDLMHIVDEDILLKDMKVYLLSVVRNANANILPYDFTATVEEHLKTIESYQGFVDKSIFSFGKIKEDGKSLLEELKYFYSKLESLSDKNINDLPIQKANDLLLELGRKLIRINSSRAGKFRHDLAIDIPALPDIAPVKELSKYNENDHLYHVTLNHLLRGCNRISSVYRELTRKLQNYDLV